MRVRQRLGQVSRDGPRPLDRGRSLLGPSTVLAVGAEQRCVLRDCAKAVSDQTSFHDRDFLSQRSCNSASGLSSRVGWRVRVCFPSVLLEWIRRFRAPMHKVWTGTHSLTLRD